MSARKPESTRMGKYFSLQTKNLILELKKQGLSSGEIQMKLQELHNIKTTRQGVSCFIKRYETTGSIHRRTPKRKPEKVQDRHLEFIDMWISKDPRISAEEIQERLYSRFSISITRQYVSKIRKKLGWKSQPIRYCQLISATNKEKRLIWCVQRLKENERFLDVIFVDESTIEMSSNGNISFYKTDSTLECLPQKMPKPKHSYKVHFWGGISYHGRTDCCIFNGIMDSVIYQKILTDNFLPFVAKKFPSGYRLYQDNDSKHCSKSTKKWMAENSVLQRVMETPASSPDLNPIENVWSEMKFYLRTKKRPKKKEELIDGIKEFWESLSAEKCGKYIDHIHKVIPQVILNSGGPTIF